MENGSDVSAISNEAAAAEVKTSCTLWCESSLDLKSVSEVFQFPLEREAMTDHLRPHSYWGAGRQFKHF